MTGRVMPTRPDHAGKRMVAGYLDADAFRAFKVLMAQQGLTTDAAVTKAVELLFRHYKAGVPRALRQRVKELGL